MAGREHNKMLYWIKKLSLELLVVIFVIGFFSQSLLNYTLPRVTSVPVIPGQVVKTYRMNGSVEYRNQLQIRFGNPVIIAEYFLEPGRRVNEGQPVFRLDPGYRVKSFDQQRAEIQSALVKERLVLEKIDNQLSGDEKEIRLIEIDLSQAEQKLKNMKVLLNSGAIPESELYDQEAAVERLRIQWEMKQLMAEEAMLSRQIERKESLLVINELEAALEQMDQGEHFYAQVDQDGVYNAAVSGMITFAAPTGRILPKDDTVLIIADANEEMEGLIYKGTLSEADGKQFTFADLLDVELEGVTEAIRIKITNLYYDASEDVYQVEGQLMRDIPRQLTIRKQYRGELVRREQAVMVVPRSALRGVNVRPGEKGTVFLLEKQEGILGDHHTVRETEVTILNVGDQYISIMGLEGFERPRVITPVTHRVRDGVKVLHGY